MSSIHIRRRTFIKKKKRQGHHNVSFLRKEDGINEEMEELSLEQKHFFFVTREIKYWMYIEQ